MNGSIAAIEAILAENAALLNEPQDIFLRRRGGGVLWVQQRTRDKRWVRGAYREYPSVEACYKAAVIANERAKFLAANGLIDAYKAGDPMAFAR